MKKFEIDKFSWVAKTHLFPVFSTYASKSILLYPALPTIYKHIYSIFTVSSSNLADDFSVVKKWKSDHELDVGEEKVLDDEEGERKEKKKEITHYDIFNINICDKCFHEKN